MNRGFIALLFFIFLLQLPSAVHAQRFVDHRDGTVTDTRYNLMWTKDANPLGKYKWDDAMSGCSSFSLAGKSDWRLPNITELLNQKDALAGHPPFYNVQPSFYWSSTSGSWWAYSLNLDTGFKDDSGKDHWAFYVWPVRDAQE
ncbi:MAG: DUF1566 domain-containing protein [Thermodesulfobacteriota bacterium]